MNCEINTLGEIYKLEGGSIQTGPFGSQLHESDYIDFGIPVIMPKDIVDDILDLSSIAYISNDNAKRLSQHIVRKNDIVCPRRGEIGKRIIIDGNNAGSFCGTGCIRLRGTGSILNQMFLFYFLKQPRVVKWIENQAIGATMMNLNTSILKSIPIKYPTLSTQCKIASILKTYDDLINNNKKRIKLLQEIAQEIYKEWFVRMRYPGHEPTKFFNEEGIEMSKGNNGYIPYGWEYITLEKLVKNIKKSYNEDHHSELEILDLARMPRKSLYLPQFGDSEDLSTSRIIFEKNDILFGSIRSYFHKVSCPGKDGITNVSVLVLRAKNDIYKTFSLMTVFSDHFIYWTTAFSNGTKMPTILQNPAKLTTLRR
jgi:type I restriction enzyme S subunit